MKTAEEIARGFDAKDRKRACHMVLIAQKEGIRIAVTRLDAVFAEHVELNDSQMVHLVREWIKEMQEVGNE